MPGILVYDTGFRFTPGAVAIDLSATEGEAHANCQGKGKGFMGIRMPGSSLSIYDFDLPGESTAPVDDWGIDAGGICGFAKTGAFQADYLKGKMKWDSVVVSAAGGDFTAAYHNFRVKAPWLNVELKGAGDPVLKAGGGKVKMTLTGSDVQVGNGPITLKATNLSLESWKISDSAGNVPAVRTDTKFDFHGGVKPFAKDVWVTDLYFGLDGKAYLKGNGTLGSTSGQIAGAPVALKSIAVAAPANAQNRLEFDFTADATLSKSGTLVGTAPVRYGIDETAEGIYKGYGPVLGKMTVQTEFPKTNSVAKAVIHVESADVAALTATAMISPDARLAYNDTAGSGLSFVALAANGTPQIVFKGSVDLGMFPGLGGGLPGGGAPSGGFVLGYVGDEDYWSAKVNYSLPGSGAVIVPEIVHLRGLNGGFGFNVTKESLRHPDLLHAEPSPGNGLLFNAGMTVGSGDSFLYTLHGDMTIPRGSGDWTPQLDFRGWVFTTSPSPSSQEDVTGFVTYSGGLHGEIWADHPKQILGQYVSVDIPKGSTGVHFGSSDWYIHAGTKEKPVHGRLFLEEADAFLALGLKEGLKVGGGYGYNRDLGDCEDGFCVYIHGNIMIDGSITPSPLHVGASAEAHGDVGGCYKDHCLGVGGGLTAAAGVPPPELKFGISLDLPCPVPDVTGGIKILPTPGLWGPSLDFCVELSDLNPF